MSAGETINVSSTGAKKAGNLQCGSMIPPKILLEIAEHFGKGGAKYSRDNWRKGYAWDWSYDALFRHMNQFWAGEDYDPETGSKHMIAAAWHCIALASFMDEHPDLDTRFVAKESLTS